MIFVSTTYYKKERSRLIEPFTQLLKLPIDGIEVGSGVYFSVVKSKNIFLSKKIIFAK